MGFVAAAGAVIRIAVEGASEAINQINRVGESMDRNGTATNSLKEQFLRFAGPAAALAATFAVLKESISAQREFDILNASLVTATGSSANAAGAFKVLQGFAASTPYGLKEVTDAFIQMRNLGLDPSEKALRSYGNTSAAMGKSLNQMVEAVADAATGEFERLKEFGIKSKVTGDQVAFTFQGVTKVIGNNAKEIESYLQKIGEINFGSAMEQRAATLDGVISNLGDAWDSTARQIAQSGIGDGAQSGVLALIGALSDLNAILDAVTGAADKEGKAVKEAGALHVALTTVFEAVAVLGVNVAYTFNAVGKELAGLAAQATLVAHGDFAGAKALGVAMKAEAEELRKAVDAKSEAILGASAKAQKAAADEAAAKQASGKDELAVYKTVLTAEQQREEDQRKHADFIKKYATVQEQLTEELKKQRKELGSTFTASDEARIRKHYADKDEDTKKQLEAYTSLMTASKTATDQNKLELAAGIKATDSQKAGIKLDQDLASGKIKLTAAQIARVRATLAEQAASEKLLKAQQTGKDVSEFISAGDLASKETTAQLAAEYAMYGKTDDARNIAMIGIGQQAALEKFLNQERKDGKVITDAQLTQLNAEVAARSRVAEAAMAQSKALGYAQQLKTQNTQFAAESLADPKARADALLKIDSDVWQERIQLSGAGTEAQKLLQGEYNTWYANQSKRLVVEVDLQRATELVTIMAAVDDAAKSAAAGMTASFGAVGTAIGGLTTALTGYSLAQATIAAELAAATEKANGDPGKVAAANAAAAQKGAQAQIKSYGDMAGAAKGFFKENSAGYKLMQTTEKAFRAYEMAMALEAMVKKIFFKESEVTANVALNATKLTGEAATTAASTGLAATEASAWGITAVVKALASLPFPLNLAAGAATLAAVVAIGAKLMGGVGGSSVSVSEQRQAANGTGSVLGDKDAKSDSIAKSLEIMQKTSGLGLAHTISMDTSLKQIVAGIGGLGSLLVQSADLSKALAASSDSSGGFLGGIANSIFGGKKTVEDSGILTNTATLGTVNAGGLHASSYVDTKTSGGWFSSDKRNTETKALGEEVNAQLSMVINGMYTTIKQDADLLGMGGDAFNQRLQSFVVDLGKISLKDMTGDEIQKALEASLSKLGDDMAKFGVQGLEQYQKVGEGYLETLSRVANDYMQVSDVLSVLGKSFTVTGAAAVSLSENLITAAGDLSTLTTNTAYFAENFLSEAERMAPIVKSVQSALDALGEGNLKTMDQFKDEVLRVSASVAAGAPGAADLLASLLALAPTFKTAADYTADLATAAGEYSVKVKTASEIASEHTDLQSKINELTLTSAQLRREERLEVAVGNRAMYDQLAALQDLSAAYNTESSALKATADSSRAYQQQLLAFNDAQKLGALSTLTPLQKATEAQRQYQETLVKAQAGDKTAQSALTSAATAYLTADQVIKSSSDAYAADAAQVQAELAALAAQAGTQASDAELQLAALDSSVGQLITLNETAVSVRDAIAALTAATRSGGQADSATTLVNGSHKNGLTSVPFNGYVAQLHQGEQVLTASQAINYRNMGTTNMSPLVDEIKSLRASNEAMVAELQGLRADQNVQTGDIITSAQKATAAAAATTAAAAKDAAKTQAVAARLEVTLK